MDGLDATILRALGLEPFAGYGHRPRGLRATDVARSLGQKVRLVQDRITRMERSGTIKGYAMVPNLRHLGLRMTIAHIPTPGPADRRVLESLADVDGFVQAVAYVNRGVCLSLCHANDEELGRRLKTAARLAGDAGAPRIMYDAELPSVKRPLSPLDWRIIAAFAPDAKRTLQSAADDVGVTVKTLRHHLARLRDEGSIDEVAKVDLSRLDGILPFEVAVWCDDAAAITPRLVTALAGAYWEHFPGVPGGYSDVLLRLFARTPAEMNRIVQAIGEHEGVTQVRPFMAADALDHSGWIHATVAHQARLHAASTSTKTGHLGP